MSPRQPRVGCGAAIMREGRILLVRRLAAPEAGCWSLPGGKVDFLEQAESAVIREAQEETGVDIVLNRLLCLTQMIGVEGEHWVSPIYLAEVASGDAVNCEPAKHDGIGWFALDGLPSQLALAVRDAAAALMSLRHA